jgi:tetratricopeptide (TPR) repeat protein
LPAQAGDKSAATAAATAARQAYDAGNFKEAADLYQQAFKSLPSQTGLLYNAARALHLAGQLLEAEAQYRVFLATPVHDKGTEAKANGYLEELRVKLAEVAAIDAEVASASREHGKAVAHWRDALGRTPDRAAWWLKRSAAEEAAGDRGSAVTSLQRYLTLAPAIAPERAKADQQLAIWEGRVKPAVATEVAPAQSRRGLGWAFIAAGATAGLAGGGLTWWAQRQQDELHDDLAKTNASGAIAGVTWTEANERAERIGSTRTWGAIAAGVGLAGVGVGVVWLLRHPGAQVAVLPDGAGATLVARF